MEAHETIRLYESYRALWDSLLAFERELVLIASDFKDIEEFHKYNFAACLQIIEFLEIDTREKDFNEVTEEIEILMGAKEYV